MEKWLLILLIPSILAVDYMDIPEDRMAPDGWRNLVWEDPGGWTTIDVSTQGINPGSDVTSQVNSLINGLDSPTILYFPPGLYYVNDLSFDYNDNNIILRGAGDSTVFDANTGTVVISLYGTHAGSPVSITQDVAPGGKTVTVSSASGFQPGDIVGVSEDLENYISWGKRGRGGVFEIVAVNGNDITLDRPLAIGLDQVSSKTADVTEFLPIENVSIEQIKFMHTSTADEDTIEVRWVNNFQVKNCTFINSSKNHVEIKQSRNVIVRDSYFYEAQHKEGGHGYVVVAENKVTGMLITNNIFQDANVCLGVQIGTSYLVYSYNLCLDRLYEICINDPIPECANREWYESKSLNGIMDGNFGMGFTFHGHYPHHNLVEGNIIYGAVIDHIWKDNGPHNTFFRNKIKGLPDYHTAVWLGGAGIHIDGPSDSQNLIGNLFLNGAFIEIGTHSYSPPRSALDTYIAANDYPGVRYFTTGVVRGPLNAWDNLSMDAALPPSLYLDSAPDFWPAGMQWPPYGPDVLEGAIPAELRYAGLSACVPMTTSELIVVVDDWKLGSVGLSYLMGAVEKWKTC